MKIFLDDKRQPPEGWTLVRWPEEAIELLMTNTVEEISLDHDLGDDTHGTGYDVVLWIEEAVATREFVAPKILVHTDNQKYNQIVSLMAKSRDLCDIVITRRH